MSSVSRTNHSSRGSILKSSIINHCSCIGSVHCTDEEDITGGEETIGQSSKARLACLKFRCTNWARKPGGLSVRKPGKKLERATALLPVPKVGTAIYSASYTGFYHSSLLIWLVVRAIRPESVISIRNSDACNTDEQRFINFLYYWYLLCVLWFNPVHLLYGRFPYIYMQWTSFVHVQRPWLRLWILSRSRAIDGL